VTFYVMLTDSWIMSYVNFQLYIINDRLIGFQVEWKLQFWFVNRFSFHDNFGMCLVKSRAKNETFTLLGTLFHFIENSNFLIFKTKKKIYNIIFWNVSSFRRWKIFLLNFPKYLNLKVVVNGRSWPKSETGCSSYVTVS